jgi:phenylalanyl-tRNA synthetase beta chain
MPTINFSKTEFEKYLGKKFKEDYLKDRISMLGTDLEGIENDEIQVEIFPNRPDMLSMQGFTRAFSSFVGIKKGLIDYQIQDSKEKVIIDESVNDIRPFTACMIVKSIKFDDEKIKEIIQMQEKLHVTYGRNRKKVAIGIYPMEKIKFPIHYKAIDKNKIKFRPLESQNEMTAKEILEKHPAGIEYKKLLTGYEKYPVFVDSNNSIMSMPPIINSFETGRVTVNTKEIFIECSGFNFDVVSKCLNMIACAFYDINAKIYSIDLVYGKKTIKSPNLTPKELDIDINYVNKILGLNLSEAKIKECLEKMGYGYKNKKVLVPCFRADVLHMIDLVEDIAIAYGYENFNAEIPKVATIAHENKFEKFKNLVIEIFTGLGYLQLNCFHLSSVEKQNKLMNTKKDLVELSNSISQDYDVLQSFLTPQLLDTYKSNKHHDYPQKIFLIAKTFSFNKTNETGVFEIFNLALSSSHENANYTEIRQILDYLFNSLNLKYEVKEQDYDYLINGRSAKILLNKKEIGFLGELSPEVITNWNLIMPCCLFELNLEAIFNEIEKIKE